MSATTEDTPEGLQYVLIRGLSAMGYAQPSVESWVLLRAALAAFLRSFPKDATLRRWEDRETGHVARLPGRELHYLASAIERLGAPGKPDAP